TFRSQQLQDLCLRSWPSLLGVELVHHSKEIIAHKRGQALLVDLFPDSRGNRHVRQHPRHAPHFGCGHETVFVLWNILCHLDGVFAHGAKPVCQFFSAVNTHGDTSLMKSVCLGPRKLLTSMRRPCPRSRPARWAFRLAFLAAVDLARPAAHYLTICRPEEHTSELQSRFDLVCRLLLEKKNNQEKLFLV